MDSCRALGLLMGDGVLSWVIFCLLLGGVLSGAVGPVFLCGRCLTACGVGCADSWDAARG